MKRVVAQAHGRVNLIGEHTDYNGGFVLPACIPQATQVELTSRPDKIVVCRSNEYAGEATYGVGEERARGHWSDYVQAVSATLARHGFYVRGFEASFTSNIPIGHGLSSSAALQLSLFKGLDELFDLGIDPVRLAQLAQLAEQDFMGCRSGIMDQMVCGLGRLNEALFIDTRDLTALRLPLMMTEMQLMVISSGVVSRDDSLYSRRRKECEQVCEILDVAQLRDLGIHDLPRLKELPDVLHRRAHHVISENARVLDAVSALQAHDFTKLGRLFLESHASLRNDFEVSVTEIDLLVELAMSHSDVFGARLTGGGFGGSIVALVRPGFAQELGERVLREYLHRTDVAGRLLVPETQVVASHSPTFHALS